ncbi:ATP-binding cassette sub-family A member 17-like isoform X1 [Centruroides sculpturatus]|uniref:ATP-binding cassette sub-family A member 17-like isoform X1 n=2 Tax=Centruroides sculpturatus TaxID=218467 RepID=UPI000C6E30DC|nr:ATP-binding cassette sub-family A member 17-like isoform X1 [Centruroides sculpturatus]
MPKQYEIFLCLLWKEWMFIRRDYVLTFVAILLPALLYAPILFIRNYNTELVTKQRDITYYTIFDPVVSNKLKMGTEEELFLFAPNNNITASLMRKAFERIETKFHIFPELVGVINEKEIEFIAKKRKKIRGAVIFNDLNFNGTGKLDYKLRFPIFYSMITRNHFKTFIKYRHWYMKNEFFSSEFLLLQHAIETTFIEMVQNESKKSFVMELLQLPTSSYSGYQLLIILDFLPYIIVYGLHLCVVVILINSSANKQREREMLLVSGVSHYLICVCDFFVSLSLIMLSLLLLLIEILCLKKEVNILSHTENSVFCIIFMIYALNASLFIMFVSSIFQHPDIKIPFCLSAWIITHTIPTIFIFPRYKRDLKTIYKFLFCLFPNVALQWICRIISLSETNGKEVTWSTLNDSSFADDFTISQIIMMMFISSIIYSTFFLFKYHFLSYFQHHSSVSVNDYNWNLKYEQHTKNDEKYFDDFHVKSQKTGISVQNLHKKNQPGKFPILNNLQIYCRESQITTILGHKNSGKSMLTLISLGLEIADNGEIYVNDEKVRGGWNNKGAIGWCPQVNISYSMLTVEENLQFFARLHGSNYSNKENINKILELLKLYSIKNLLGKFLLRQELRKLCIGIAMIHDPRVIILDEPSFGFSSKETLHLLDILNKICHNKTILFLTRSKHEALLTERIIFLVHGNIKCSGSLEDLQKKYECGSRVIIDVQNGSQYESIVEYIHSLTEEVNIIKSNKEIIVWLFASNRIYIVNQIIQFVEGKFPFKIFNVTMADILGSLTKLKNDCSCSKSVKIPKDLKNITLMIFIMLVLSSLKEFSVFVIKPFIYLFPTICVVWSLEDIYVRMLKDNICPEILESLLLTCDKLRDGSLLYACCHEYNTLQRQNVYLENCAFMVIFGILYFTILLCIEHHFFTAINNRYQILKRMSKFPEIVISEDFSQENIFIVKNLRKKIHLDFNIRNVSFSIEKSKCFGILGPSNAGKSTLLKCLIGIISIDNGIILFDDYNIMLNYQKYQSQVGYCPQNEGLLWNLTGKQTIKLFATLRGIERHHIPKIINHLFRSLGLNEEDKLVREYSGCNKKLLSIAISLLDYPPLIFLDEPTSHMNNDIRNCVWKTLLEIKNDPYLQTSFVITTSSFDECTKLCDRMAFLVNGNMYCVGDVSDLQETFAIGYLVTIFIDDSKIDPIELTECISKIFEKINSVIFEVFAEAKLPWWLN